MEKSLIVLDFGDKPIGTVMTEIVYPFGNYSKPNFKNFLIAVRSPGQYYYTDIFASFILSPEDAWKLYYRLLTEQQVEMNSLDETSILASIPDHMKTLKDQFKSYYVMAYKSVIQYIEPDKYTQSSSPKPK